MQDRVCEEVIEVAEGPSVCTHKQRAERQASTIQEESAYTTKVWIESPFDEVLSATRHALSGLDCPILSELDVRDLLKSDLNVTFPRYAILKVLKTDWIHQALDIDRDAGVLFPLSMAVYEQSDGTVVEAIDPIAEFAIAGGELDRVARMAKQTLIDVVDRVAAAFA